MIRRARTSVIAVATAGCLVLVGCAASDDTRQAASVGAWAPCKAGFATECVVAVPERGTVVVKNGTTIIFAEQGKPVQGLAPTRICWAGEDDVDAATCADGGSPLPEWLLVEPTSAQASGATWPALSVRIFEITDSEGESLMPLPAVIDVAVEGASAGSTVSIEVACCDVVQTPQAAFPAPTVPTPVQDEGVSA